MEALRRLQSHCARVRTLLQDHQYRIQQMASGQHRHHVAGGLILSLDLQKAFDRVLRSRLIAALQQLNVDPQLIQLLIQFYRTTTFSFHHRGESRTITTHRGIRQGCKSAPILWACYMGSILEQAAAQIDWTWIHDMLTGFADDICLHNVFETEADVHQAVRRCGQFVDLPQDSGLTVNMKKTIAILRLVGPGAGKLLKQYLKRTKEGIFLLLPCKTGTVLIRLVKQIPYLGAILHYNNFEKYTMQHRIKMATKVGHQLTRWLHTNHLNKYQKLKLWYQCVFPCVTYGLRSIGITTSTLTMLDRMMMAQLRRIFREPTHLTHLSHVDFLEQFRIPDPLQQLLQQFDTASRRDTYRFECISPEDILFRTPVPDHGHLIQVISVVLDRQRGQARWTEVDLQEYQCDICGSMVSSLAQLRRHQTRVHGRTTGLLRTAQPTDIAKGVPTCTRCHAQFTTWHNFKHHVQYVCLATQQEGDDVEHRLRVREFLQLVRGLNYVALGQQPALCAYFLQRCILCGKFITTIKGMLQHWQEDHTNTFRHHGQWNDLIQQSCPQHNPCLFCGTTSKGEHKRIVLRQYAMHLTHTGEPAPTAQLTSATTFQCVKCSKVYTTKHGLDQHLRNYHRALQDGTQLSSALFDANCLVMQAVETGEVAETLFDDNVKSLLSQTCLACQKQFNRKNELMRHLSNHHADFWNQITNTAAAMEKQWKQHVDCYCVPFIHNRKHQCIFFLQYALLRITLGVVPDEADARAHPDMMLSPREVVTQLTWLGLLPMLLFKSHMKMSLSLHCIFCAARFSSPMLLSGHLHQQHAADIREAHEWTRMVAWVLFATHGCVCNPATHHGVPGHYCPLQLQVAHIIRTSDLQVAIPWSFRTTDVMDLLEMSLSEPALKKVATLIMSRQFEKLIDCPEVLQMLSQRCLWCNEAVNLSQALAPVRIIHDFDLRNIQVIVQQLAVVAAQTHDGFWCKYCGELLPSTEIACDIAPEPEKHLPQCPYIKMLAVMLSHPVWHKRPYDPDIWPGTDEVEKAYHDLQLRLIQFNVRPSATSDTFGATFEMLAECGLFMMSDPQFLQDIRHRCLQCHKCFYSPKTFLQHVQKHNYRQLDTQLCLHRLHMRRDTPCQFCGTDCSSHPLAQPCPTLFNLATFLTHGSTGTNGSGQRYLAGDPDSCSVSTAGPHGQGRTSSKATQAGIHQFFHKKLETGDQQAFGDARQIGATHREQPELTAPRTSVPDPHQSGPRVNLAIDAGRHQEVARLGQEHTASPQSGGPDAGDVGAENRSPGQIEPGRFSLERSGEDVSDQWRRSHAILEMGPIIKDATTHQRRYTSDTSSLEGCPESSQAGQDPTTTLRFHALTKTSSDRSVPWLWLVSSRNQPEAWAEARQLCFHAIWQLIRCQIKPQGVEKSALAKQIQQQLNHA